MAGSSSITLMGVGKVAAVAPFSPSDVAGLVVWNEARDLALSDGDPVSTFSGHGGKQNLTAAGVARPTYNVVSTKPQLTFDNTNDVAAGASTVSVKHVFVVASCATATFTNYKGIFTGINPTENPDVLLVGDSGQTKFYNEALTTVYHKDGTLFAEGDMQAPMSGAWAVLSLSATTGWGSIHPQVGCDRDVAGRFWQGGLRAVLAYDNVLSTTDRQSVETYLTALL